MSDLENNLFQENGTTEIAHQGLDFDEEEEECNNHVRQGFSEPPLLQLNTANIFNSYIGYVTVTVQWSLSGIKTKTKLASDLRESLL